MIAFHRVSLIGYKIHDTLPVVDVLSSLYICSNSLFLSKFRININFVMDFIFTAKQITRLHKLYAISIRCIFQLNINIECRIANKLFVTCLKEEVQVFLKAIAVSDYIITSLAN